MFVSCFHLDSSCLYRYTRHTKHDTRGFSVLCSQLCPTWYCASASRRAGAVTRPIRVSSESQRAGGTIWWAGCCVIGIHWTWIGCGFGAQVRPGDSAQLVHAQLESGWTNRAPGAYSGTLLLLVSLYALSLPQPLATCSCACQTAHPQNPPTLPTPMHSSHLFPLVSAISTSPYTLSACVIVKWRLSGLEIRIVSLESSALPACPSTPGHWFHGVQCIYLCIALTL